MCAAAGQHKGHAGTVQQQERSPQRACMQSTAAGQELQVHCSTAEGCAGASAAQQQQRHASAAAGASCTLSCRGSSEGRQTLHQQHTGAALCLQTVDSIQHITGTTPFHLPITACHMKHSSSCLERAAASHLPCPVMHTTPGFLPFQHRLQAVRLDRFGTVLLLGTLLFPTHTCLYLFLPSGITDSNTHVTCDMCLPACLPVFTSPGTTALPLWACPPAWQPSTA
jgi:hypothetical protein